MRRALERALRSAVADTPFLRAPEQLLPPPEDSASVVKRGYCGVRSIPITHFGSSDRFESNVPGGCVLRREGSHYRFFTPPHVTVEVIESVVDAH